MRLSKKLSNVREIKTIVRIYQSIYLEAHVYFACYVVLGKSGIVFAVKLYPAGATTNSQDGVTDIFGKCLPVLEEMVRQEMPLLVSSLGSVHS
jgi:dihydroorotase